MKTVGIIAEYNPFHNGHLYQLEEAKKLTGADAAVVVLSGDFTQRGTPALIDKYARCEMALRCGADLVIELPVCFATGSAEYFAKGAVSILDSLSVDALCFGSECGDIDALNRVADILAKEPESYRYSLRENLKLGMSFPAARSLALKSCFTTPDAPDAVAIAGLLQSPNNILGVEYLKALKRRGSSMEVHTVVRKGAGYLEQGLKSGTNCSALAIRQALYDSSDTGRFQSFMPAEALSVLSRELSGGYPVIANDFSSMLFYRLLFLKEEGYTAFADVSEALSDKISRNLEQYLSFSQFCEEILKSKNLTYTRLSRSLMHILLDIRQKDLEEYGAAGDALYARILGFRKSSQPLFSTLGTGLPLLSKLADSEKLLSPLAKRQLSTDIFAAHLYDSIVAQKTGRPIQNEYRRQIVLIY